MSEHACCSFTPHEIKEMMKMRKKTTWPKIVQGIWNTDIAPKHPDTLSRILLSVPYFVGFFFFSFNFITKK